MASTNRPYNLSTRNQVVENHDTQVASLPEDHLVRVIFAAILTSAVLNWRAARAGRVAAAGDAAGALDALHESDDKNDKRIRTTIKLIELKHGYEAVEDLRARAGGFTMGELTRLPVDRALVALGDLFASVDGAAERPVYADDLEELRVTTADLAAKSAAEAKARQTLTAASAAEYDATSILDLCASRAARAVVAALGEDAAAAYLPRLPVRESRAPDAAE